MRAMAAPLIPNAKWQRTRADAVRVGDVVLLWDCGPFEVTAVQDVPPNLVKFSSSNRWPAYARFDETVDVAVVELVPEGSGRCPDCDTVLETNWRGTVLPCGVCWDRGQGVL